MGNTPCASNASESGCPPLPGREHLPVWSERTCSSRVSTVTPGPARSASPARNRVRNCWLKITNWASFTLRRRDSRHPCLPQQPRRSDRVNKIALLHVAVADLFFREALLALLGYVAAFVGHFDKIFGHGDFNALYGKRFMGKAQAAEADRRDRRSIQSNTWRRTGSWIKATPASQTQLAGDTTPTPSQGPSSVAPNTSTPRGGSKWNRPSLIGALSRSPAKRKSVTEPSSE